jgi:hypothetical protein
LRGRQRQNANGAKVIHAEGGCRFEKLYQAAGVLAQEPQAIQLRYLETLTVIGVTRTPPSYSADGHHRPASERPTRGNTPPRLMRSRRRSGIVNFLAT